MNLRLRQMNDWLIDIAFSNRRCLPQIVSAQANIKNWQNEKEVWSRSVS